MFISEHIQKGRELELGHRNVKARKKYVHYIQYNNNITFTAQLKLN